MRARRKSSSILRTASMFRRIALQVDSARTAIASLFMSGELGPPRFLLCLRLSQVPCVAGGAQLRP